MILKSKVTKIIALQIIGLPIIKAGLNKKLTIQIA